MKREEEVKIEQKAPARDLCGEYVVNKEAFGLDQRNQIYEFQISS